MDTYVAQRRTRVAAARPGALLRVPLVPAVDLEPGDALAGTADHAELGVYHQGRLRAVFHLDTDVTAYRMVMVDDDWAPDAVGRTTLPEYLPRLH